MKTARKFVGALVVGGTAWATAVINSPAGGVTKPEWIGLVGVVSTAVIVYLLKNDAPTTTP